MIRKIETKNAPAAIGPYSQAVCANNMLFLSGQIPVNPETGLVVEGGVKEQAERVFKNIDAVLSASGAKKENIVKACVFIKDMNDFGLVNEVYSAYFSGCEVLPARSCVEVARLPKDVLVEIEAIAIL